MPDCSFGIIPFRVDADAIRFLLVWETWGEGHWNFPKGHAEDGETPLQTALRELKEETGLTPEAVISTEPLVQTYSFDDNGRKVDRRLEYFVARMRNDEVTLRVEEVSRFEWMTLDELLVTTPFPELRETALQAHFLATTR
ncbi:MAG: NUDIX domain-containing protein [Patescibacteria group bacterium]